MIANWFMLGVVAAACILNYGMSLRILIRGARNRAEVFGAVIGFCFATEMLTLGFILALIVFDWPGLGSNRRLLNVVHYLTVFVVILGLGVAAWRAFRWTKRAEISADFADGPNDNAATVPANDHPRSPRPGT